MLGELKRKGPKGLQGLFCAEIRNRILSTEGRGVRLCRALSQPQGSQDKRKGMSPEELCQLCDFENASVRQLPLQGCLTYKKPPPRKDLQ